MLISMINKLKTKRYKSHFIGEYKLSYKYKEMQDITSDDDARFGDQLFKATVSYKVHDEDGALITSARNKRVICGFNNSESAKPDEINPFAGLTYKDLSEDIKMQILLTKIKELVKIDLKLLQNRWSTWEEIPINIDED